MSVEFSNQQRNFILDHGEKYVQCPYKLSHTITNAKYIVHISKCRKEYEKECEKQGKPRSYFMRSCKWNAQHICCLPELKDHEDNCPDKYKAVETIRYHQGEHFSRQREEEERRRKEEEREWHKKHKHKDKERERYKDRDKDRDRDRGDRNRHRYDHHRDKERDKYRDRNRDGERIERISRDPPPRKFDKDFDDFASKRRKSYNEDQRRPPPMPKPQPPPPPPNTNVDPSNPWGDDAEDWETEAKGYEPAYVPDIKLNSEPIMYNPRGLTKAERRQHRVEQRRKAMEMKKQYIPSDDESTDEEFETKPAVNVKQEVDKDKGQDNDYSDYHRYDDSIAKSMTDIPTPPASISASTSSIPYEEEPRRWEELSSSSKYWYSSLQRRAPPPKVERRPVEKEDGECSDDEELDFKGEDPFEGYELNTP